MSRSNRSSFVNGVVLVAALAAAVSCDQPFEPKDRADDAGAGGQVLHAAARRPIPDRYVVVMKPRAGSPRQLAADLVVPAGGRVHHVYEHALSGLAMTLPAQALNGIRNHPSVAYVIQDEMAYLIDTAPSAGAPGMQTAATWGLDRIDQRDLPLDGTFTFDGTGAGVTAYVIDSGILPAHEEFGSRASIGIDLIDDGQNGIDCNGHGTHVAGTIGGTTYGVAKDVSLVAVRVFGCDSSTPFSVIIAAVDWVTAHASLPAVVNMSLGGSAFEPLNDAVRNSIAAGLVYTVAAGNDWGADACMLSPAGTREALTVGSTTQADVRSPFSNVGPCVDIFAPGSAITSAWPTDPAATNTISGTSMASPHVAGLAALYLEGSPAASPATVSNVILGTATPGRLSDVGPGSPNLLLYAPLTPPESGAVIGLQPSVLQINVFDIATASGTAASSAGRSDLAFEVRSNGRVAGKRFAGGGVTQSLPASPGTESRIVVLSNLGDEALEWTADATASWLSVSPAAGSLAAYDTVGLVVTVDPDGLGIGDHEAAITVSDPNAVNSPRTLTVTLTVLTVVDLESDVPVSGLSGAAGSQRFFRIQVPEGAGSLQVQTFGGSGDLDLFLRYADLPDPFSGLFDCLSGGWSNDESCMIVSPPAGDWFVQLYAYGDYTDATIVATIADPAAMIDVWPDYLFFQQLIDPATGVPVSAARPAARPDRGEVMARTQSAASGARTNVSPRSIRPEQSIWLMNPGSAMLNWSAQSDRSWLDVNPTAGGLAPWESTELMAAVNAAGLTAGRHSGTITIADPAALNSPRSVYVDLSVSVLGILQLGVPQELPGGWDNYELYFRVSVPDGLPALRVSTSGGRGNLSLFLRHGSPPDLWWGEFDCAAGGSPADEQCLVQNPAGGDWYILLFGPGTFEGVTLLAEAGEAMPVIDLWPNYLFFQELIDPTTGTFVAGSPSAAKPDRTRAGAARTAAGSSKSYPGVGSSDEAAPRSFHSGQYVWLGNIGAAPLNWTAQSDEPWIAVNPNSGSVAPADGTELAVTVNPAGLTPGFHTGTFSVADPSAFNSPQVVWVDVSVSMLRVLRLGVPEENLSGGWDTGPQYFRVTVPEGAKDLHLTTYGGTGDLDMFVRHGSPPDLVWWEFDCLSIGSTNDESCSFADPSAGDWYVMLYPYEPYQGATLLATAALSIESLSRQVQSLEQAGVLTRGQASSLRSKLDEAIAARDSGDLATARNSLNAFILEINALRRAGRLDAGAADALAAAAAAVIDGLGG